jgi:hypothetical protein
VSENQNSEIAMPDFNDHKKANRLLGLIFSGGVYSSVVATVSGLAFMQITSGGLDPANFVGVLAFGAIWFAPLNFVIGAIAAIIAAVFAQRTTSALRSALKAALVGGIAGALFGLPGVFAGVFTGFTYALAFKKLLRPLAVAP